MQQRKKVTIKILNIHSKNFKLIITCLVGIIIFEKQTNSIYSVIIWLRRDTSILVGIKMSLLEQFNILLNVFCFFGLAPFSSSAIDSKLNNLTSVIIPILSSILSISLTSFLIFFPHLEAFGFINLILTFGSLVSILLTNLAANGQCCRHRSIYENVIDRIEGMESSYKQQFSQKLPVQSFARQYRLKVLLIGILLLTSTAIFMVETWYISGSYGVMCACFAFVLKLNIGLVMVHVILYVDIIQMFFHELNQHIQNSPICFYSSSKIEFLKNVKLMHMDLCKLIRKTNIFFEWSLLFVMIAYVIDTTYNAYWLFLAFNSKPNVLAIMGKFRCTISI